MSTLELTTARSCGRVEYTQSSNMLRFVSFNIFIHLLNYIRKNAFYLFITILPFNLHYSLIISKMSILIFGFPSKYRLIS